MSTTLNFKDLLLQRQRSNLSNYAVSSDEDERPLVTAVDKTKPTSTDFQQRVLPLATPASSNFVSLPVGGGFNPVQQHQQQRDYVSKLAERPAAPQEAASDSEDDEPRTSKYKISNLITLFNKSNIELTAIFTYRKRVQMIQVIHETFTYFIYIPSKYEMYIDRSLGIATYDLSDDDENEGEGTQDTLFYSKLPIQNLRREKKSKCKNLTRFLPLVSESPIKILYIEEYFLCFINRHNEVDSMILLSPFKTSGYFFLTDLEFFFKNLTKLLDEFSKFEKALTEAVYDKLTVEVDAAKAAVAKAQKTVAKLDPKGEKKEFAKRIVKLNDYYKDDKHREKAKGMLLKLRSKNLKKMFDIENLTYVMKEFK